MFVNLIDNFTPTHLEVLRVIERGITAVERDRFSFDRILTDQVIMDLLARGLISDTRPYVARGREDPSYSLITYRWDVTGLGKEFVRFMSRTI